MSLDGIIVVDKAEGWTSHDVVNKMRRLANMKKVGHLGTLDPIATGVLPLVIGRATRLAQFYAHRDKVYDAIIRFDAARCHSPRKAFGLRRKPFVSLHFFVKDERRAFWPRL